VKNPPAVTRQVNGARAIPSVEVSGMILQETFQPPVERYIAVQQNGDELFWGEFAEPV
jgi:hypothetical protein